MFAANKLFATANLHCQNRWKQSLPSTNVRVSGIEISKANSVEIIE